jgi:hypothetical protein
VTRTPSGGCSVGWRPGRQRPEGWYPEALPGPGHKAISPARSFRLPARTRTNGVAGTSSGHRGWPARRSWNGGSPPVRRGEGCRRAPAGAHVTRIAKGRWTCEREHQREHRLGRSSSEDAAEGEQAATKYQRPRGPQPVGRQRLEQLHHRRLFAQNERSGSASDRATRAAGTSIASGIRPRTGPPPRRPARRPSRPTGRRRAHGRANAGSSRRPPGAASRRGVAPCECSGGIPRTRSTPASRR